MTLDALGYIITYKFENAMRNKHLVTWKPAIIYPSQYRLRITLINYWIPQEIGMLRQWLTIWFVIYWKIATVDRSEADICNDDYSTIRGSEAYSL